MVFTDADGLLLYCSPAEPASCADITHARKLGLVTALSDGPAVEILADAGYQGLGAQTGGRVVTPPHRKFKKNAPDWYEARATAQGPFLAPYPCRAGHRSSQELASPRPPPWPTRAHE
ncbi:hypothetical protein ACWEOP_11880 [Streptomyces chartreusis]